MNNDRVKVKNVTKYAIGVRLINGIERNIPAGAAMSLPKEDVEYIMSVAPRLFEAPCQLHVQDEELCALAGIDASEENIQTDEELIRKKLKGTAAALEKWIADIDQQHVLETIFAIAQTMDLPVSKVHVLKNKMPERYFMEEE